MTTGSKESESFSGCCSITHPVPAAGRVTSSSNRGNNITLVHADPADFRALVQKLTGAPDDCAAKLPVASPAKPPSPASKRQKLRERRRAPAKMEILLDPVGARCGVHRCRCYPASSCPTDTVQRCSVSSSPIPILASSPSSTTGKEDEATEVKRAIAAEGFCPHPSSRNAGAANYAKCPKLLPLFPLHPPNSNSSSRSAT